MYTPSFRVSNTNIPIVSKDELDVFGERFVMDFQPEAITHPQPINIEEFVEYYLKMTMDYQYLSHNGIYLGMTVFNDTNKVAVYSPETKRAEYISAKARTVIIDNSLLEENKEHRYRFTLGHEGSHEILHSVVFGYNPDQVSFFTEQPYPMIQCRVDLGHYSNKPVNQWTDHERMEWQANFLSSAILMPKSGIMAIGNSFAKKRDITTKMKMVGTVVNTYNVSPDAARNRLKRFGYLAADDDSDYSLSTAILRTV
ncbi:MAG: ImmA/IrrE family metallo-endopeptidase [Clostridia bacterium]|nr:ImmA/IrrE family metallo-endopeptidase [Clostridia bacterium]